MALSIPNLYPVALTPEQRTRLDDITRNGCAPAKKSRHAHVVLLCDQVARQLDMHVNTVDRIRKRFVTEGEAPALDRKPRLTPPVPPKSGGHVEAHLVAICCGKAPEGHTRWTLQLLADELRRRGLVTQVCAETVRRALKKPSCSPGASSAGASRSETTPASSPRGKTSSTSTPRRTRRTSR
jgi:transposase